MSKDELRPDIAAARNQMRMKTGAGKEIKRLDSHLWEGERVERMAKGIYGGIGLLVLTDRRLLFLFEGMMRKKSEDFPLDKISSVQWSSGFATGTLTIFASGNKTEIKSVNNDDGGELVAIIRSRLSQPKDQANVAAATNAPTGAAFRIRSGSSVSCATLAS